MHGSLLKASKVALCYLILHTYCFAQAPLDIKLGMSTALSGPAQAIGSQLKAGANIYFEQLKPKWWNKGCQSGPFGIR